MGILRDFLDDGLTNTRQRVRLLEQRVEQIEDDVRVTNQTVIRLLQLFEEHFGRDLDGDGRIG